MPPLRTLIVRCILAVALAFALPLLLMPSAQNSRTPPAPTPSPHPTPEQAGNLGERAQYGAGSDAALQLRVLQDGQTQNMSMAEYLPMALAGEMPASFAAEALKAQAVALRTYVLYLRGHPKSAHPDADICTSSGCCAAAFDEEDMRAAWGSSFEVYFAAVCSAVTATDGQYLRWEDEPILAVFHSCSQGFTEDCGNIWSPLPYLQSVSSPETAEQVRNLVTTVEVSPEEFRTALRRSFPTLEPKGEPSQWLGEIKRNSAGRVDKAEIAGQELSGLSLRAIFGLRSTDFSLVWNGTAFVFTVSGYGHGVGMSQHGANAMALEGSDYREILAHYYPGTELAV